MKRSSGVLLHISSLPGKYGIGTLGHEARSLRIFVIRQDLAGGRCFQSGRLVMGIHPISLIRYLQGIQI